MVGKDGLAPQETVFEKYAREEMARLSHEADEYVATNDMAATTLRLNRRDMLIVDALAEHVNCSRQSLLFDLIVDGLPAAVNGTFSVYTDSEAAKQQFLEKALAGYEEPETEYEK